MLNILFAVTSFLVTSFYSLQITDVNGNTRSMEEFRHKRILLVNIATNSSKVAQLGELQQLQQQWGDSLVIIAFPSNSFGNETRSDEQIRQLCQSAYGSTYVIASKGSVRGAGIQSVYSWLGSSSNNGVMNAVITHDFQKLLIDREGKIVAVFNGAVSPLSTAVQNAVAEN